MELKSYKAKTLASMDLGTAVFQLGRRVQCAKHSEQFSKQYFGGTAVGRTVGLLWVYNHDNEADPNKLERRLGQLARTSVDPPKGCEVHVVGPGQMNFLLSVANDLKRARQHRPLFPHLRNHAADEKSAVPVESLGAPYQIVEYTTTDEKPEIRVYWNGGHDLEDFHYLVDHLVRYQYIGQYENNAPKQVSVKLYSPPNGAITTAQAAWRTYAASAFSTHLDDALKRMKFSTMTSIATHFSREEIGMAPR